MKPRLISFIPAAVWVAVIYILLTMPSSDIPSIPLLDQLDFDKWVHAGLFGVLVMLIAFPLIKYYPENRTLFILIAVGCCLYGIAMEYVQKYLTSDRDFDVLDMVADACGCMIGYGLVGAVKKARRKNSV